MLCPKCHGTGTLERMTKHPTQSVLRISVCPDCNGSGRAHCCEGEVCQPENQSSATAVELPCDCERSEAN